MLQVISVLFATLLPASLTAQIPQQFEGTNPSRHVPIWIAASAAVDQNENIRAETIAPTEYRALQATVEKARQRVQMQDSSASAQCDITIAGLEDGVADMGSATSWTSLQELTRSRRIHHGRVKGATVGFYLGVPFTVVQVQALSDTQPNIVYVLFPKGTVRVGGVSICTSDPRYPDVPPVGSEIAFIAGTTLDKGATLYRIPGERIFSVEGERIITGKRFAADPSIKQFRSLKELIGQLNIQKSSTIRDRK